MNLSRLVVAGILLIIGNAFATDRLRIEIRDPNYLPYTATLISEYEVPPGRLNLPVPAQCCQFERDGDTLSIGAVAINPQFQDGSLSQIMFFTTHDWTPAGTHALNLTLADFVLYYDSAAHSAAIIASGYRHDSAFVCKLTAGSQAQTYTLLGTGYDRVRAPWRGLREFLFLGDLDNDGADEAVFRFGASRDPSQQHLVCIDPSTMTPRWTTRFPYFATQVAVSRCASAETSLLFIGNDSRPEITSPTFNDLYTRLVRVSSAGEILFDRIIGKTGEAMPLVADESSGLAYLCHNLRFAGSWDEADTSTSGHFLSSVDCANTVRGTVETPAMVSDLWLADYAGDSGKEIFSLMPRAVIRVLDTSLTVVVESDELPTLGTFCGVASGLVAQEPCIVFSTENQVSLYSRDYSRLASIPAAAQRFQTLRQSKQHPPMLLATTVNGYTVLSIHKRPLGEYLTILYLDYRYYLLSGVSVLIIGLVLIGRFNRKVSAHKKEIEIAHTRLENAHRELLATHQALKEAQARLVDQEKYRLAQDIAGSFAHEIRNALFPVDMSVAKIGEVLDRDSIDRQRLEKLLNLSRQAVTRAIGLTDFISMYTRLEAQYLPEPTRFAAVVDEVLTANRGRIDAQGVKVTAEGDRRMHVAMRDAHLYMIVNNLVLNALDALTDRPLARIILSWGAKDGSLEFACQDNGCGVAEADQERILEAFYSTKPNKGTGLGLAIAKRLVDMYGGSISLVSKPDQGTTFTLLLPLTNHEDNPA